MSLQYVVPVLLSNVWLNLAPVVWVVVFLETRTCLVACQEQGPGPVSSRQVGCCPSPFLSPT